MGLWDEKQIHTVSSLKTSQLTGGHSIFMSFVDSRRGLIPPFFLSYNILLNINTGQMYFILHNYT